ncbi:MAG: crotonase/enoyl-CoA hydratase family protein [Hyphomonadaceae bacterium]|nr:crotonase/enoyl-CoA hydratase family protein [Hyphomonadaceae bacterium]
MSELVLVERVGSAQVITINRPYARNAVNPETAALLREAFESGEAEEEVKVHILTGAEGHFCAGADLKAVANRAPFERKAPMGPSWLNLQKPSIAAVEGNAVAGGLELAILCDLRVASETAIFGVYCRRWGVPLIDGGTVRLPRLIGQSRAMDMILTGRGVQADEALSFGLANRVVPAGLALQEALALAEQIAAFPETCMRNDRISAMRQWSLPMDEALKFEAEIGRDSLRAGASSGAARFADGKGRGGDFGDI